MPECRDNECECGHLKEMHNGVGTLYPCMWRTCTCEDYNQCSAASMFVMKGKRPFQFEITGRGMCYEEMEMKDVKVYLQGLLSHADKNILNRFDYPSHVKNLDPDRKGLELIFDMITRVEGN